jgi:hypothetical protein
MSALNNHSVSGGDSGYGDIHCCGGRTRIRPPENKSCKGIKDDHLPYSSHDHTYNGLELQEINLTFLSKWPIAIASQTAMSLSSVELQALDMP